MRTRLSIGACLLAVLTMVLSALPVAAGAAPRATQRPAGPITRLLEWRATSDRADVDQMLGVSARLSAEQASREQRSGRYRLPRNYARLLARFVALEGDAPEKTHRQLRAEIRSEGLEEYIHVGPLHGRRFTLTVISDQACATARPHRRGSARLGPCTAADRRASMTPLQDSAGLLLFFARDIFEFVPRADAIREMYDPGTLRFIAPLVAPRGVEVSAIADRDRDRLDDDGRVAFHANGRTVCATLPASAKSSGAVTFGSCQRLRPRHVNVPR